VLALNFRFIQRDIGDYGSFELMEGSLGSL
jgi:hypothetical protein